MTEKVLIGTTFWGLALVAMEKLNVYGFSLYFFPFMFRCETGYFKHCKQHKITFGLFCFSFGFSFLHPCLSIENEKKA